MLTAPVPSAPTDRGIVLRHCTKEYPRGKGVPPLVAVDDVDLTIAADSFTAVVGASGSGKTTLLELIAGLQTPSRGEVVAGGAVVHGPGRQRGVVFQQDAIFPWRTVIGNVEYGLAIGKVPKHERRELARQYLRLVGLDRFEDYYPYELSGGMKKRVALAAVLVNRPQVLLLDEPFGALDYVTKRLLQQELSAIWQTERQTAVLVTHDIEEALFLADRVIVLRGGRVQRDLIVPFARPRSDELRDSPGFAVQKEALWRDIGADQPSDALPDVRTDA